MEKKQSSIDWLVEEINKQKAWADPSRLEPIIEKAKQMEKEQQESEQIELINWLKDSLKAKEFYITYEAEELLEKFKTK